MSLERRLAEIQTRARNIARRSIMGYREGKEVDWSRVNNYADGIIHEAEIVYDCFRKAKRSDDLSTVNRYLGEFAIGLKNMADSTNGLLQTLYNPSENRVSHKEITEIEGRAPNFDDGTSMLKLFLDTHDHVNGDVVKMRNRRSHGSGHNLVLVTSDGKLKVAHENSPIDVEDWMNMRLTSYFDMVGNILQNISENENERIAEQYQFTEVRILGNIANNWRKRYQKAIGIGLAAATAVGSVLGMAYLMERSEKERAVLEGNAIRDLIMASKITNTSPWTVRYDRTTAIKAIDEIKMRNKGRGDKLDEYVGKTFDMGSRLNVNFEREYNSFVDERKNLFESLDKLRKRLESSEHIPSVEIIDNISYLLMEERRLMESHQNTINKLRLR